MASITADRVKETSTTTGTGNITLAGAVAGFRAFSDLCANGDSVHYCIAHQTPGQWEVGTGTWGTGGILLRAVVLASSNAGALVDFASGAKDVFLTAPASKMLIKDANNAVTIEAGTTDPPAAATGTLKLYGKDIAGCAHPQWIGSSGLDTVVMPHMAFKKIAWWNAPGSSQSTPGLDGMGAPTYGGTPTARDMLATSMFTRLRRLGYVSTNTVGSVTGQWYPFGLWTMGNGAGLGGFLYAIRFGVSDAAVVAGARQFVGMSGIFGTPTNIEPSTMINSIGVGHGAADTNLKLYYGGSAAQTPIDLGVNFPANTLSVDAYELVLFARPNASNEVGYRVTRLNTGHVAQGTLIAATPGTQLPLSSTLLAFRTWRCNNATALAVGIDIVQFYIETDT